jgi:hypothetical protein
LADFVEKVLATGGFCDSLKLWRKGGSAMMGDRLVMQESLFYEFCFDEFVPSDQILRSIDRFIDLSDLRRHLAGAGYRRLALLFRPLDTSKDIALQRA